MSAPGSLKRKISPPPIRKIASDTQPDSAPRDQADDRPASDQSRPSLAAIEAGEAVIRDHLEHFADALSEHRRPIKHDQPSLSINGFRNLWNRNQHDHGNHFVVHQHDHPVAGRSAPSRRRGRSGSCRGNSNSIRPNRMAIETRVHNLWNHLIESASHQTGSLLIWDTGEYEVLPRYPKRRDAALTEDELSTGSDIESKHQPTSPTESEKLFQAFRSRHIRLRLHGTRLPKGYTIALRLPSANDKSTQPRKPKRRRRRKAPEAPRTLSDSDTGSDGLAETSKKASPGDVEDENLQAAIASEDEYEAQNEQIRSTNAYPGATNTIGSIHQRQWFLTLDRPSSGFVKATKGMDRGRWVRRELEDGTSDGFETFVVRGRDEERSIVTGRLAAQVMADEGVKDYAGRKMWRPITE